MCPSGDRSQTGGYPMTVIDLPCSTSPRKTCTSIRTGPMHGCARIGGLPIARPRGRSASSPCWSLRGCAARAARPALRLRQRGRVDPLRRWRRSAARLRRVPLEFAHPLPVVVICGLLGDATDHGTGNCLSVIRNRDALCWWRVSEWLGKAGTATDSSLTARHAGGSTSGGRQL
jgi:hypothetical protein